MSYSGKILLVDDEPHIRKYLTLVVKKLGTPTVIEADNGEDAVRLFLAERPKLVLLDINMPAMNGLDTLKKIRQADEHCIIIMLTSLTNRQTVEEAISVGASNYIRKDTPQAEILKMIQETLEEPAEGQS